MMMSYATSEIGTFSMINPHDWVVTIVNKLHWKHGRLHRLARCENFTANSFLINRSSWNYLWKNLDVQLTDTFTTLQAAGISAQLSENTTQAATRLGNMLVQANQGLAATNEIYNALHCTAGKTVGTTQIIAANSCW